MNTENNTPKTGKEKLMEQFLADGFSYMFGNPGTVEQGFLDVLRQYPIQYVTCLHESVAVAMADGYARKTQRPTLVQLHSGVGLGNGIGMLYQAYRGHTPLVVIAGEAGTQYSSMDAQMACDLVEMARPVTKYAERVIHPDSLLRLVRRAVKAAMTPPRGPVFLSLPMDVLDAPNQEPVFPSVQLELGSSPEKRLMEQTAEWLLEAKRPLFLAGDGVSDSGAVPELDQCARLVEAKVCGVNTSCINFNPLSPLYKGDLGHMFGENSAAQVQEADVVLVAGAYLFPEVFPSLSSPFAKDAKIIHIDWDSYEIAKNHPVTLGVVAHPKKSLAMLAECLEARLTPEEARARMERTKAPDHPPVPVSDGTPAAALMEELRKKINENWIIFDEALTASSYVHSYLPRIKEGTLFQTRGGSLGVGIPGGMGIQLADPAANVLVFTGDGGSMYTIQALYNALRNHLPVKIIICNNGSYQLLEQNIQVYWRQISQAPHDYPDCFFLEPSVDYVGIAASMGVPGIRVSSREQVQEAVEGLTKPGIPFLVELMMK